MTRPQTWWSICGIYPLLQTIAFFAHDLLSISTSKPLVESSFQLFPRALASPSHSSTGHSPHRNPNPTPSPPGTLNLARVPLAKSCEILRVVYNNTGGTYWSNQDGWQFVDSILVPSERQQNEQQDKSPKGHSAKYSPSSKGDITKQRQEHNTRDELPRTLSYRREVPLVSPNDGQDISGPGILVDYPSDLDPNNCCGWYGVVCIGPDGKIPPPWPPYDEDLISRPANRRPVNRGRADSSGINYNGMNPPHVSTHSGKTPQSSTDDWYIIELHLGFNALSGPVPPEIGDLANLMVLDLSNNDLTGEIPASFAKLSNLKRFDISSNKITGMFPEAATKMTSVQELVLKNNYFKGPLPKEILQLRQLTELSLGNNEFDGILPLGMFRLLNKLRVINISQNGFVGEIGPEIGELNDLIKFSARANEFTGVIPTEIGSCSHLMTLNLGDNRLTGAIPESIFGLQNLRVLDLPDNKLSGSISPKIGNLISMTRLVLSHNDLSGPLPVELQNLSRLEFMVINYNNFNGSFPIAAAPAPLQVCLVQPNEFSSCPPNASVETSTTLAYQCNLDCREQVLHPKLADIQSKAFTMTHFTNTVAHIILVSVVTWVLYSA